MLGSMAGPVNPVKRVVAYLEAKDVVQAATHIHDDFQFSGFGSDPLNKDQFVSLMKSLFAAIPDWSYHPRELREEPETVRFKAQVTGTHSGMLVGLDQAWRPFPPRARQSNSRRTRSSARCAMARSRP